MKRIIMIVALALAIVGCSQPDPAEELIGRWEELGDQSSIMRLEFTSNGVVYADWLESSPTIASELGLGLDNSIGPLDYHVNGEGELCHGDHCYPYEINGDYLIYNDLEFRRIK